ncbi:hypothetical protein AK812_SmicGene5536 [Symbiodinium microadriaticum]|uniref:Uncharacterized protein n=1 Tax=Symbiodinium microadriaticum TaxID=2951 RepID=A0A1Q9ETH9_SYMMI|nr:hypothetical protein AK812_SmicGene5536 [Symbiodinium microadriaticum]
MAMPGGVRFPVKGPLLDSWDAAVTFCQSVPKLAERIIKVSFGQSGGADGFTKYLVMTGLCGYVNHFEGVLSAPNAKLVALPENGLGDHLSLRNLLNSISDASILADLSMIRIVLSLLAQLTKQVSKQKEICLCYPDTHPVPKIAPLPKAVAKRRPKKKAAPPEESKPDAKAESNPDSKPESKAPAETEAADDMDLGSPEEDAEQAEQEGAEQENNA